MNHLRSGGSKDLDPPRVGQQCDAAGKCDGEAGNHAELSGWSGHEVKTSYCGDEDNGGDENRDDIHSSDDGGFVEPGVCA